jgi:hypothetical protein
MEWILTILSLIRTVWENIGRFLGLVRSPLLLEVHDFQYREVVNDPRSLVVFICTYPCSYEAAISITNRSEQVVFVKSIAVTINEGKTFPASYEEGSLRLEPGQVLRTVMTFPLKEKGGPIEKGTFSICMSPAKGRDSVICGGFPKKAEE